MDSSVAHSTQVQPWDLAPTAQDILRLDLGPTRHRQDMLSRGPVSQAYHGPSPVVTGLHQVGHCLPVACAFPAAPAKG